jgi:hypothetical protein
MVSITALWLPILLAAVIVFVASSVMHMVLPYHRSDYKKIADEDKVRAAIRGANLSPGLYIFPYCTHKDMKSPELVAKQKEGPVGMMTIVPNGPPVMAKFLTLWFAFCVIVSGFVAYLTGHTLPPGINYMEVFYVAATAAFMAYGLANITNGIWRGQSWSVVAKEMFDGLVYSLLTAGTFGWLWPR